MAQDVSTQNSPLSDNNRDLKAFGIVLVCVAGWFMLYTSIQSLADWLVYVLLSLSQASHLGQSLAFFF